MLVTIYTDGGTDGGKNKDVSAWAFVARSQCGYLNGSGHATYTKHSEVIEFEAVRQAAFAVIQQWPDVSILFFNVDNNSVIRSMYAMANMPGYKASGTLSKIVSRFYRDMRMLSIEIRAKHVKAHKGVSCARTYMNDKVDRMVRKKYK